MVRQVLMGMTLTMAVFVCIICITLPNVNHRVVHQSPSNLAPRFTRIANNINLTGPTVNSIPNKVEWLQDLSYLNICNNTDPFIIAVVPSAIPNIAQRTYIRKTWANPRYYPYTRMRAVFVLGTPANNASAQEAIEAEMQIHEDIIQYNFIDSYRNLTYKTLSWMSWVNKYCLQAPWVAKIDDDIVVNPFHLHSYLLDELKRKPSPEEIHGRLRTNLPALRDGKWLVTEKENEAQAISSSSTLPPMLPTSDSAIQYIFGILKPSNPAFRKGRWKVTKEEYPDDKYPPFVLGPAYVIGSNAIQRLLRYSSYTPFLWLEDVYMTGLVAYAAKVKHVQADKTLYCKKLTRKLYSGKIAFYIGASEKNKKTAWSGIMRYSPFSKRSKRKL